MKIRHLRSGITHTLLSVHLVGRAEHSDLRIDNRLVSNRHAEFRWSGAAWELHDLNSSNGTHLDGDRIIGRRRLQCGMRLAFGDAGDTFEIIDTRAPLPWATRDDQVVVEGGGGVLSLPDPDAPEISVIERGDGRWLIEERSGDRRPVENGHEERIGGHLWTLHLPVITEATWQSGESRLTLRDLLFRFLVGGDGQTIDIEVIRGDTRLFWPSRAHHRLLLHLAKQRLADQADPMISAAEAGWVAAATVLRDLAITDNNNLYAYIHRVRKKLGEAGVFGAADIIERRFGSGQLRIGGGRLEIVHP
jgi:hypothetical protein